MSFTFLQLSCAKKRADDVTPEKSIENLDLKVISVTHQGNIEHRDISVLASLLNSPELSARIKYGVSKNKIVYQTTYKGNIIEASGMIYLPIGLKEPAPLLSAQHGTTFEKSGAPSVSSGMSFYELFASGGYITFVPDFIGYGSSAHLFHPYYDQKHSALAVIDLIKTGKKYLKEKNIAFNDKLYLIGYSEGGYVTLAAQKEIDADPSIGLNLTAVAAGAGGYDLTGMLGDMGKTNYYSYPAYLAFIIKSFNITYDWDKPSSYFFKKIYADRVDRTMDGSKGGGEINGLLTTNLDSLFNPAFYNNIKAGSEIQFKKALISNSLIDFKVASPLRLYHAKGDEVIPYQNSIATKSKLEQQGGRAIEIRLSEGGSHGSGLTPMLKDALPWFESFN